MTEEEPTAIIESLRDLAAKSAGGQRLSPGEEDSGASKLKTLLEGEKESFSEAVGLVARLPWIIVTKAIPPIWKDLKVTQKRQILGAFSEEKTDAARRVRLSLARALLPEDAETSLKLITSTAREALEEGEGILPPAARQTFGQVLVGKGKPHFSQIDPSELKNPDATALAEVALAAAFPSKCPPRTQLMILEWLSKTNLFEKIDPGHYADATRVVKKWSSSLRGAVAKLENLPEALKEVATAPPRQQPQQQPPSQRSRREARQEEAEVEEVPVSEEDTSAPEEGHEAPEGESGEPADTDDAPLVLSEEGEVVEAAEPSDEGDEDDEEDEEDEDDEEEGAEPSEGGDQPSRRREGRREDRRDRPRDRDRDRDRDRQRGNNKGSGGNVGEGGNKPGFRRIIDQLGAEFAAQQREIDRLRALVKSREEENRKLRKREPLPNQEPIEILQARNMQLEETTALLREQLEQLAADHEDMALSQRAGTDSPETDPKTQLLTFLGIKLSEDYATFDALRNEQDNEVLRDHYKGVLASIFELLQSQGVKFEPPKE